MLGRAHRAFFFFMFIFRTTTVKSIALPCTRYVVGSTIGSYDIMILYYELIGSFGTMRQLLWYHEPTTMMVGSSGTNTTTIDIILDFNDTTVLLYYYCCSSSPLRPLDDASPYRSLCLGFLYETQSGLRSP